MGTKHSKYTVILIAGNDISAFCDSSNFSAKAKSEDNTTYGKNSEVYDPALKSSDFGCGGTYFTGATGPRAVLIPLVGTKVNIKNRPEGTGTGLPQDSFDAVIEEYAETAPVAGYRKWTLKVQPSDDVDYTVQ